MPFRLLARNSRPSSRRAPNGLQGLQGLVLHGQEISRPTSASRSRPRPLLCGRACRRAFHLETVLLPPVVFTVLLGTLWLFKCTMMVVFQNKIIYMPGLPPNARSERIETYAKECGGIQWQQQRMRTSDGIALALAVAVVDVSGEPPNSTSALDNQPAPLHVYILYFQGNASSIPPRLPDLSRVLRAVRDSADLKSTKARVTMVCLSYRGYWTSKGRPSEHGLNKDAPAALKWIADLHEKTCLDQQGAREVRSVLLLWGQSIGAGIATNLAAAPGAFASRMRIDGIVLETPFLSTRAMLETLYPQKWVPYKHLWPFLWNHLDSWKNLEVIAAAVRAEHAEPPDILLAVAGRDELVPAEHPQKLQWRCRDLNLPVEMRIVQDAYHNEVAVKAEGRQAVSGFIVSQIQKGLERDT